MFAEQSLQKTKPEKKEADPFFIWCIIVLPSFFFTFFFFFFGEGLHYQ